MDSIKELKESEGKIKNSLKELKESDLNCGVCLTEFDNHNHEPYVLYCGHTICLNTFVGLWEQ